jgi:hypothetical protein
MQGRKTLALLAVAAVISITFAVNEARTQKGPDPIFDARADLFRTEDTQGGMSGEKPFQVAFVTRIDTIVGETTSGMAESLAAKRPGKMLGTVEEIVANRRPEDPMNPQGRLFADVQGALDTPKGSIFWEGLIQLAPMLDGVLTSTSTPIGSAGVATITGGTGKYAGAQGTATLAGRISICPPIAPFCAPSDDPMLPPGLGLRIENQWVLRGTVPGRDRGDDDDDDFR